MSKSEVKKDFEQVLRKKLIALEISAIYFPTVLKKLNSAKLYRSKQNNLLKK